MLLDQSAIPEIREEVKSKNEWLNSAFHLDIYHSSGLPGFTHLNNHIFEQICKNRRIHKKRRSKDTLRLILLNLWVSYYCGRPVMYPRRPAEYQRGERYNLIYYRYNRVVGMMDALRDLDYITQYPGYYNRKHGIRHRTRAFAKESLAKLFEEFIPFNFDVVDPQPPERIIQLRDENKNGVDYQQSDFTEKIHYNLRLYNELIRDNEILLEIPGDMPIELDFMNNLRRYLLQGLIKIADEKYSGILSYRNTQDSNQTCIYTYSLPLPDMPRVRMVLPLPLFIISTITGKELLKKFCFKDDDGKLKVRLSDFGIPHIPLRLNYEVLHRVFNNSSFDLGGRFYGATHLQLSKNLRSQIKILEQPVCELDFSALHIRMLYHLKKIDYRNDPYEIVCRSPEERPIFKILQLISINAKSEKIAIKAIRDDLRKRPIQANLSTQGIQDLLRRFQHAHNPIKQYFNSGVGLRLQNMDSQIADKILTTFTQKGIPILPVHDSYIVPASEKNALEQAMSDEYEKLMGFQPIIKSAV